MRRNHQNIENFKVLLTKKERNKKKNENKKKKEKKKKEKEKFIRECV
jgi:hypothetical protein